MKRLLLDNYPRVCVVEILSNAMLKSVNSSYRMRKTVGTVGYLSTLTFEKGITTFLEVAKEISNDSKSPAFLIAGPCRDSNIMDAVKAATALCPNVQYVGPVYGDAKQKFLDSMDVLLFPTTYSNEAEPLVILEAAAAGVPVIAWDRGCIAETFPIGVEGTSVTVPREVSFIQTAGEQLKQWMTFPELMERASERTRIRFEEMANGAIEKLTRAFE
jgi:glycosyltransferase involved in cell wall biosynthesis